MSHRNELTVHGALLFKKKNIVFLWVATHIAVSLIVWFSLMSRVEHARTEADAALKQSLSLIAQGYAEQLQTAFDSVNTLSLNLVYFWEHSRNTIELPSQSKIGLFGNNQLVTATITNKEGDIVQTSFNLKPYGNMRGRQYFNDFTTGRLTGLQIIPPSKGERTGKTIIRFVRDTRDENGSFNGLVTLAITPQYLSYRYVDSALIEQTTFTIIDKNKSIFFNQAAKQITTDHGIFFNIPEIINHQVSMVNGKIFKDKRYRYAISEKIEGYPFKVLLTQDFDKALAPFDLMKREYRSFAYIWFIFSAIVLVAGLIQYGKLLRRIDIETRVKKIYRLAREGAGEGYFMLEPLFNKRNEAYDFRVRDANEFGANFYGLSSKEIINEPIMHRFKGNSSSGILTLFSSVLASGFYEDDFQVPDSSPLKLDWVHRKIVFVDGLLAITLIDISERKKQELLTSEAANIDVVTNLPNRYWLLEFLPSTFAKAKSTNSKIAVLFVDLDNFKEVNDTLSHQSGDAVLKLVGDKLKSNIRPADKVARLGGDEFIVILMNVLGEDEITQVCRRILEELSSPFVIDNIQIPRISASIGISIFPVDGKEVPELLHHADEAMYRAKNNGKNGFSFFLKK